MTQPRTSDDRIAHAIGDMQAKIDELCKSETELIQAGKKLCKRCNKIRIADYEDKRQQFAAAVVAMEAALAEAEKPKKEVQ